MKTPVSSATKIIYARLKKMDRAAHRDIRALVGQLVGNATENRYAPAIMARAVRDPRTYVLTARDDTSVIGMATLIALATPSGLYGIVEDVVVDEGARGRGVGRALIEHIIAEARRQHMTMLELTSSPSRIAANHLYQSLGFQKRETNPYRLMLTRA